MAVAAADRRGLLAAVAALPGHAPPGRGRRGRLHGGRPGDRRVPGPAPVRLAGRPGRARRRPAPGGRRRRVGDPAAARRGRWRPRRAPHPAWSGTARRPPTRSCWSCGRPTRAGLLYRVATALDEAGAEVRAARISTLGGDVVDAFYLVGAWADDAERDRVEAGRAGRRRREGPRQRRTRYGAPATPAPAYAGGVAGAACGATFAGPPGRHARGMNLPVRDRRAHQAVRRR